ncbi:MAG: hypothetical protein JWN98_614 [Abditibacteriota bacterium]|nr:hypothetical protein [Abditibacteriota bacterium]
MKQQYLKLWEPALRAAQVMGLAACLLTPVAAQQRGMSQNFGRNDVQNGGNNGGGVIALPKGVRNVISIDAHNTLLAEVEDATGESSEYVQMQVRHVYSGGIAKILGGTIVPTEQFVSPAFNKQGGFGNNGFQAAQPGLNGGNMNGNFNVNPSGAGMGAGAGFGNGYGFGNGVGNGYGYYGTTTVTGANGATGTLPNFGGFIGNGQVVPQNGMSQSTLNRQPARISVNTGSRQLNQVLGLLDRPLPQVEVGTSVGSTGNSSSR